MARTREELAWAAGFFDGEGGTYCGREGTTRPTLTLAVGQAETSTLERFNEAIGSLGKVRGPYLAGMKQRRYWTLRVGSFEKVQAAVAMLWPFMSEPKRQQAHAAIRAWEEHLLVNQKTHCQRGHERTEENLYQGRCRACVRLSHTRRRERLRNGR